MGTFVWRKGVTTFSSTEYKSALLSSTTRHWTLYGREMIYNEHVEWIERVYVTNCEVFKIEWKSTVTKPQLELSNRWSWFVDRRTNSECTEWDKRVEWSQTMKKLSRSSISGQLYLLVFFPLASLRFLKAVWFSDWLNVKMIDKSVSWHGNMCPNVNGHTGN